MKAVTKAAILTALTVSILVPVQAEEYMDLDNGKTVTITNGQGVVVASGIKGQTIAHVGREDSTAYAEAKVNGHMLVTNLKTKEVLGDNVESVIYSDYNYIAIKHTGEKGYILYNTHGDRICDTVFDAIDPISPHLLLGETDNTWHLYQMPYVSLLAPGIDNWVPMDDANIIIGIKGSENTKSSYDATLESPAEKVYYNYKGQLISAEEAKVAAQAAIEKRKAESPVPIAAPKKELEIIPMPAQLNGGQLTIKEVLAPFSEGIAFVKADNKKKYAINPQGDILFSVDDYDTFEAYNQGLAYVGRKTKSFNLGGLLNTVLVGVSIGHNYDDNYYYRHRHHGYYSPYYGPYYGGSGLGYNGVWIDTSASYSWTKSKVKHGYIDHKGTEIISSKNDAVGPITDQGIMVYNKGTYGVYNKSGQVIIPMNYSDMLYMNQHKSYIVENKESKKYGVLSTSNQVLLPFKYEKILPISKTQLKAKENNLWHLVTPGMNYQVSEYGYNSIDPIYNSTVDSTIIPASKDKEVLLIDTYTGTQRFDLPDGAKEVKDITKDHVVFKGKKGYGVVDYSGKVIVEPIYKDITIVQQGKNK